MTPALQEAMTRHLQGWGLRWFDSDSPYFEWQRQVLSPAELAELHRRIGQKRDGADKEETAFYDASADTKLFPVLYSQRYDYYRTIGPLVLTRLGDAESILDFGCGPGILTTFYAVHHPEKSFVGVDRSPVSIERARERARELSLGNVRFECLDVTLETIPGSYDCVVATHALLQSEGDPGLPSRDWTTFERAHNLELQTRFEERTGLGVRLDILVERLSPAGRLIVFEKTRQLARRVPFQRALGRRGFTLVAPPLPVTYRLVEEVSEDGPLYVATRTKADAIAWDEAPEADPGAPFDPCRVTAASRHPDKPLYENHWPSAQTVWNQLENRTVARETTRGDADGRQMHVELGDAGGHTYLYCSHTFDQRQLVIFPASQSGTLERYYDEIRDSV